MENSFQKQLFSSLVSDIKHYNGEDPIRPWIQGIRKMKESLPPNILQEKLPRFLQKCVQTFETDRRYRNDSRYLRVWILLMDYVDDARVLLRKMEKNHIGLKRAMFYSAYALYYEKRKKFEDAERIYHMGVQNLAEPADELHKSYEQFLHRLKMVKQRKAQKQEAMLNNGRSSSFPFQQGEVSQLSLPKMDSGDHHRNVEFVNIMEGFSKFPGGGGKGSKNSIELKLKDSAKDNQDSEEVNDSFGHEGNADLAFTKQTSFCGDVTVVKFVSSAIAGKCEAEDACYHGLVEPTINTKDAMNAISSMFREPLELETVARRPNKNKPKENLQKNAYEVFVDESTEEEIHSRNKPKLMNLYSPEKEIKTEPPKPFVGAFKIWTNEDSDDDNDDMSGDEDGIEIKELLKGSKPKPHGLKFSSNTEASAMSSEDVRPKEDTPMQVFVGEDTVIRRFVGSAVFSEPEIENACHHGLVDPTINMKEAMDDINNMFGKPLNFVRANRPKKQAKSVELKQASHGFSILPDDDDVEHSIGQALRSTSSTKFSEGGLLEPTVFTKEAISDINDMFGKPLDL